MLVLEKVLDVDERVDVDVVVVTTVELDHVVLLFVAVDVLEIVVKVPVVTVPVVLVIDFVVDDIELVDVAVVAVVNVESVVLDVRLVAVMLVAVVVEVVVMHIVYSPCTVGVASEFVGSWACLVYKSSTVQCVPGRFGHDSDCVVARGRQRSPT